MRNLVTLIALSILVAAPVRASDSLVPNVGFEAVSEGLFDGWNNVWSRKHGAATLAIDTNIVHAGRFAARIEHTDENDWSFAPKTELAVLPGDNFEITAWLRTRGEGAAHIGFIAYDKNHKALQWEAAKRELHGDRDWTQLHSRYIVPEGVARIAPRCLGYGIATAWIDDFDVRKSGRIDNLRDAKLPAEISITNDALIVTLRTADATLAVTDRRTKQTWTQRATSHDAMVTSVAMDGSAIVAKLYNAATDSKFTATIKPDGNLPECVVAIAGDGELAEPLAWPEPFVSDAGTRLIVPMNEGISYPVEDATIDEMKLVGYGGHGICMAFWGVDANGPGQMAIIETPDDMAIRVEHSRDGLVIAPEWEGQKGRFGYERKLRYVFLDRGGYVAMCKRYRAYIAAKGELKTLKQKRDENPNVDLLVGAVNIWCWGRDGVEVVRELQSNGIQRILWSGGGKAETIKAINEIPDVLSSRYDIYQDLMDPSILSNQLRGSYNYGWTQDAWPDDINRLSNGDWRKGWGIDAKDGTRYYCAVICDRQALKYARERVPAELEQKPYRGRFIDTTTAAPWYECYASNHPMTRTESRIWKMKLLEFMSKDMKLVTGSETGHDASVPYLCFFEGMMSLGPYRVPDAGRKMQDIVDPPPERVAKFQLGHRYRLPLWELVYHDCTVSYWYWGDYNNKLPALWDARDRFNALYGTPPMFMFTQKFWNDNKARFTQSYRASAAVTRATGYSEMTDHKILSPDRDVQQTTFANGVTVTVNFGANDFLLPDGVRVEAGSIHVKPARDDATLTEISKGWK